MGGNLQISTGDLAVVLGTNVYEDQNCLQAWAEFGTCHLIELLNSVRNRILDFSLAIWKEQPTAGESDASKSDTIEPSRITQIFNTSVYGGAANLVGSANDSIVTFNLTAGDFSSLESILRENGVIEEDIEELKTALKTEKKLAPKKGFGPKVSSWIAKMVNKAAEGAWAIGVGSSGTLLAEVIAKYYGIK